MLLSNTSEYAVRILLFMSNQPDKKYSAAELIKKLKISDKYLRRIMTNLAKNGFIESISGRSGGYVFKKAMDEINIGDIVFSIEGKEKYSKCILGFVNCGRTHACKLHSTWLKTKDEIFNLLYNTSLNDLSEAKAVRF